MGSNKQRTKPEKKLGRGELKRVPPFFGREGDTYFYCLMLMLVKQHFEGGAIHSTALIGTSQTEAVTHFCMEFTGERMDGIPSDDEVLKVLRFSLFFMLR